MALARRRRAQAGCRARRARDYGGGPRVRDSDRPLDRTEEPELNAAPAAQIRLLDLQALDSRLDQLAHRRRTLPELAEVEKLTARIAELGSLVVAAQTQESDIAREQARLEADVDQVRARAARDEKRLDAGQVSSPKELESLQHEIGSLARRQSDLEDAVLEVMERREEVQARTAQLTAERDSALRDRESAEGRRDAAVSEIDSEAAAVAERHVATVAEIPADLFALYGKLRAQLGGVGAAPIRGGRCEGCRLELHTTDLHRIREAPEDAVLRCEECRRILVRTPESGL